jgi:Protein of unknown function (DUF2844)
MNRPAPFGFPNGKTVRRLLPSVLLALAFPAWASLGDNVTSVQVDKARMKGTLRSVATQQYVKHEIQTPTGQMVREFVSPEGTVFGVAWEGPFQPDLQQVLGSYFEPVKQAVSAQQRHGHGPISVETSGFVFQQGGHARSFHGRAYVPSMVPQGVDVTEIQ